VSRPDRDPGGIVWLVGLIDLMLPWVGVPLTVVGFVMGVRGHADGWWVLSIGLLMLAIDVLLTFVWARHPGWQSDQPTLNRRGDQYVGRKVHVVEEIIGGEGKVRVADTVWRARGPDCAAGARVTVVGSDGACLIVAADDSDQGDPPPQLH
jgi:membrane protein implicated in regulation of membrane protease activity